MIVSTYWIVTSISLLWRYLWSTEIYPIWKDDMFTARSWWKHHLYSSEVMILLEKLQSKKLQDRSLKKKKPQNSGFEGLRTRASGLLPTEVQSHMFGARQIRFTAWIKNVHHFDSSCKDGNVAVIAWFSHMAVFFSRRVSLHFMISWYLYFVNVFTYFIATSI